MRRDNKIYWGIGSLIASFVAVVSLYTQSVYASITRTDAPAGTAGTVMPDQQISGGTVFRILSTTDPSLESFKFQSDQFKYGPDTIPINNGKDSSGGIWAFEHTWGVNGSIGKNNGYKMVGVSSVSQWITALKGDSSYVNSHRYDTTFFDRQGDKFSVSSISQIVNMSGASFAPGPYTFNQAVYATDPAYGQITLVGSSTQYTKGQAVRFSDHAFVEGYHTNWHFEYVKVVDANGNDVTSQCFDNSSLQGKAPQNGETLYSPDGNVMTEVAGGGTTSYPPSFVQSVNGGSSSPNSIDTSRLSDGWYTIELYVKDWFNRGNTSPATVQFEVGKGSPPSPPPSPPPVVPGITLTADPPSCVSGQPTVLTYKVDQPLPSGDSVSVSSFGGQNGWNATNLTSQTQSYVEAEHVSPGQQLPVTCVASIVDSTGKVVSAASATVTWRNDWNGAAITLTANPTILSAGQGTSLVAKTTGSIPSGYSLVIFNETTGQQITASNQSTASGLYTSYAAVTDDFVAYVSDGYEEVSANSNVVPVTWCAANITASPTALAVSKSTTLKATADNMPSGYYLLIVDKDTNQVLAQGSSSTMSVSHQESGAVTKSFVACISATPDLSGVMYHSPPVDVQWYSVALTANPISLPVGSATNLTATASNLPSGYAVMIFNQTKNKVLAMGPVGQTVVTATDSRSTPEADKYVAEVAVPPATGDQLWVCENGTVYHTVPGADITKPGAWASAGRPSSGQIWSMGYDPNTGTIYAGTNSPGALYYYSAGQWKTVSGVTNVNAYCFAYNPVSKGFFFSGTAAEGAGLFVADPSVPGKFSHLSNPPVIAGKSRNILRSLSVNVSSGTMYGEDGSGYVCYYDKNGNFAGSGGDGFSDGIDLSAYVDPFSSWVHCFGWPPSQSYRYDYFGGTGFTVNQNHALDSGGGGGQNDAVIGNTWAFAGLYGVGIEDRGSSTINATDATRSNFTFGVTGLGSYANSFVVSSGSGPGITPRWGGGSGYGLYMSNSNPGSGSLSWTTIPDPQSGSAGSGDFSCLLSIPEPNPDKVWASEYNGKTNAPIGVFYTDANKDLTKPGAWTNAGNPSQYPVISLAVDPNTQTLYAGDSGTWTDSTLARVWYYAGGTSWVQVPAIGTKVNQFVYNPVSKKFFAITTRGWYVADPTIPGQFTALPDNVGGVQQRHGRAYVIIDPKTGNMYALDDQNQNSYPELTEFDPNGNYVATSANFFTAFETYVGFAIDPYNQRIITSAIGENSAEYIDVNPMYTRTYIQGTSAWGGMEPSGADWYATNSKGDTLYTNNYSMQEEKNGTFPSSGQTPGNTNYSGVTILNDRFIVTGSNGTWASTSWSGGGGGGLYMSAQASDSGWVSLPDPYNGQPGIGQFPAILHVSGSGSAGQLPTDVQAVSDPVTVTWYNNVLQLYDAGVFHTDHWLENLNDWNQKNSSQVRALSTFWAGEEFVTKVRPSFTTGITSGAATISGLQYSSYVPIGAPSSLSVPLSVGASGWLAGNTDPSLSTWLQYLSPGTYTATFSVTANGTTVTAQAQFQVSGNWTDYWRNSQVY